MAAKVYKGKFAAPPSLPWVIVIFKIACESILIRLMFYFISRGKQFHEALEMLAAFKRGLCGGVKIKLGRLQV